MSSDQLPAIVDLLDSRPTQWVPTIGECVNVTLTSEQLAVVKATLEAGAPPDWSRELIKEIAMDIGKEVVAHIEVMYPQAIVACPSTFKLSVRNSIYNEIMAAIAVNEAGKVEARLKDRRKFRRWWVAQYRKIRSRRHGDEDPPQAAEAPPAEHEAAE